MFQRKIKLLLFFLFLFQITFAQKTVPNRGHVFDDQVIPRIDILIEQDSLGLLYTPGDEWMNHEYPVTFIFNNYEEIDTLENVGFRFRGNTSRTSEKKSFKLSFNTFQSGRKYKGLEKMNINGEHNDPSIARARIAWDVLRTFDVLGSRANHVELYINNEYKGLYLNVEHIDEEFIQKRFSDPSGNLYKCLWPADLNYISNNPNDYKFISGNRRTYDLKTNKTLDNYSGLAQFIDVLNNASNSELECELDKVFNVNAYLKSAAFDVLIGHWDGPIYNKNNFYLYENPSTGKIEHISYDFDNTFGIDWSQTNFNQKNIYNWSPTWEDLPLYERLMENPVFRKRFTFYIKQLANQIFNTDSIFPYIDNLKTQLNPSVVEDPLYPLGYGFSISDFNNSFNNSLNYNHTPIGIKPYIESRIASALAQAENTNAAPIIKQVENNYPGLNESITIRAIVEDETTISGELFVITNTGPVSSMLFDDGQHEDGGANDNIWGTTLPGVPESAVIEYFVVFTDSENATSRYPVCDTKIIKIAPVVPNLVINEFMAANNTSIADEFGEYDDWIEIYNHSNMPLYLGDFYLSDNLENPTKWKMDGLWINPTKYLLIWADGDTHQGDNHANFKLSASGEQIGIFASQENSFAVVDSLSYGEQILDISQGRLPNATGPFQFLDIPTPKENNETMTSIDQEDIDFSYEIYPNPFSDKIQCSFTFHHAQLPTLIITNILGQIVFEKSFTEKTAQLQFNWNRKDQQNNRVANGIYNIQLSLKNGSRKNIMIIAQ